ncbi:MAG: ribulose bisphosphate carboxylase small subunit [Pseudomonadota bacterium]|jgi:Ribulose bisphosphate carboxylase small subunit|nr:MAG: ribulose bisphosphate carboxylase small subunit [Pseudomonadota bacterium]
MRLTQGTFSFLPDLTDEQIRAQLEYCLQKGWAVSIEYTDDPHPRNTYWEMYGNPLFDLHDPAGIMKEIESCRRTFPNHYVRVNAFDATRGWESLRLSFIVNRPPHEPGFALTRQEGPGRQQRYAMRAYATDRPEGERYTVVEPRTRRGTTQ